MRARTLTVLAAGAVLVAGCSAGGSEDDAARGRPSASASPSPSPTTSPSVAGPEATRGADAAAPPPVSVLGLAEQRHRGDRLRLGAVRERTAAYTSYDVTYRSRVDPAAR